MSKIQSTLLIVSLLLLFSISLLTGKHAYLVSNAGINLMIDKNSAGFIDRIVKKENKENTEAMVNPNIILMKFTNGIKFDKGKLLILTSKEALRLNVMDHGWKILL